jgi:copper chaperone CopZ
MQTSAATDSRAALRSPLPPGIPAHGATRASRVVRVERALRKAPGYAPAPAPRISVQRLELALEGATCADCARRIESAVKELPGVFEARVNFAARTASVAIDPVLASRAGVVEAIVHAGFGIARSAAPLQLAVARTFTP